MSVPPEAAGEQILKAHFAVNEVNVLGSQRLSFNAIELIHSQSILSSRKIDVDHDFSILR